MNDIRVNALIDSYFNGTLDGEERASLEQTLLASSQARELFCRKAEIHEALRAWGSEQWDSLADVLAAAESQPSRFRELAARATRLISATAVAVGVAVAVGSVLGAGMALAFIGQPRQMARMAVPVANGSFEAGVSNFDQSCVSGQRLERLPDRFGMWAGDGVRPCGVERGVQPAEGRSMVAFERALTGPGSTANPRADSCDLFQMVDLSPYRDLIAQGGCVLTLSTKVYDAADSEIPPATYGIGLHVFNGSLREVGDNWTHAQPLTFSIERRVCSPSGAKGWRDLSTRVFLPTEASLAVVQVATTSMDRSPGRPSAEFDRHYYDAVRLTLDAPNGKMATGPAGPSEHLRPFSPHESGASP